MSDRDAFRYLLLAAVVAALLLFGMVVLVGPSN